MYRMGQNNRMRRCLTALEAQIVLKELHEGVAKGHFVVNFTGGQLYSKIFMTFAKAVIAIRKLEDSKQRVWPSW